MTSRQRAYYNLPGWFSAILLAIVGFFFIREINSIDARLTEIRLDNKATAQQHHKLRDTVFELRGDVEAFHPEARRR